jgi:hypothetical protein
MVNPHVSISISGLALVSAASLIYGWSEREEAENLRKQNASLAAQIVSWRESDHMQRGVNILLQNQLEATTVALNQLRAEMHINDNSLQALPSQGFRQPTHFGP